MTYGLNMTWNIRAEYDVYVWAEYNVSDEYDVRTGWIWHIGLIMTYGLYNGVYNGHRTEFGQPEPLNPPHPTIKTHNLSH